MYEEPTVGKREMERKLENLRMSHRILCDIAEDENTSTDREEAACKQVARDEDSAREVFARIGIRLISSDYEDGRLVLKIGETEENL